MSEVKCSVFPSGQVSWHQWKQGAKDGDLCECGAQRLVSLTHNPESPQSKLTEMESVLAWASENVVSVRHFLVFPLNTEWYVDCKKGEHYTHNDLYAALKSAWDARDK